MTSPLAAGRVPHLLLEAVELAPQRDTRRQQTVRNHLQAWMSGDQFSDPLLEARWRGWPDLETKAMVRAHEITGAIAAAATNAQAGPNWLRSQPLDLEEVRPALNSLASDAKRAGEMVVRLRALMNKDVSFIARDPSETCRDFRLDAAFTIRRLG